MLASPVGSARSAQVSPRSDERKSRVPPTSAHTTVADGALICAIEGSEIGDGDGELDAVGVGDGAAAVGVALGVGVGDVAAFGWFEHAARNRARTTITRIGYSVSPRGAPRSNRVVVRGQATGDRLYGLPGDGATPRPTQTDPSGHNYSPTDTNSDAGTTLTPHFWRYSSARGRTQLSEGFLGLLDSVFGLVSRDVGIDLGTANTLVHVRGRGIVISEPSVVAKDARTGAVLAIGAEAKRMVGRTPASIIAIRPLRDGVISDFDITEQMLRYFIQKVHSGMALLPRPRVIIGIPSGVTEVEKRAVQDAALSAGARWARLVEEPMAAAIGAGLPVNEPSGSMIVDIGGGTTEVAVTSLGGIVVSRSIRIGGDEMDENIVAYARREFNLLMGERTAEDIKIAIGSAYPLDEEVTTFFRGRDLLTGLPRSIEVTSAQIREALDPSVDQIVDAIKDTIEETPPELVADVMDQGIYLAGGGALLRGLDTRVAEATQMAVHIADDPLTCVARGCGKILEELENYERSLVMETYAALPR
ncbi:MAG: rod shape-determining protein [Chloroflexi bacterium]|nr:MAG: rod shape-determining protein [Chloroflexota bacterium]TMG54191.1 MAG: rod shape-determining protein [Chloroflexota bacterium]